jgi:amino-acid N-acetyltransferase
MTRPATPQPREAQQKAAATSRNVSARGRGLLRRARRSDVAAIHALISRYAAAGLLLPRSLEEIRAHRDHFLLAAETGRLLGCVALESYGAGLAEIRSLAVEESQRGRGLGGRLLAFALEEAARRGLRRVFAVTHAPEIFEAHGFARLDRRGITEKVARDCATCPKAAGCALIGVSISLVLEGAPLRADTAPLPVFSS